MKGALLILACTVAAGLVLYLLHIAGERRRKKAGGDRAVEESVPAGGPDGEGCCGMHITCERDSLLQGFSDKIVYYDDYELDAYKGVASDGYTDGQIEEFRDVLLTLLPDDIAGWARSLRLRGVELPEAVREEMLMLVAEARERKTSRQ